MFDSDYLDYQIKSKTWMRTKIRGFYLRHIEKYNIGKAIDLGCGIGELLSILPEGSEGLEINKSAVSYCRKKGLNVQHYNPISDDYQLKNFKFEEYQTLILRHVLEHLDDPHLVLSKILTTCCRLGIKRVIVVVPGKKGFNFDKTHNVFIDEAFIFDNNLHDVDDFSISILEYFPFNYRFIGDWFTHNEMIIVYE